MPMKRLIGNKRAHYIKDKLHVREIIGLLFFKKGYPRITKEMRSMLVDYFLPEIEGLEKLTGKDLSDWKRREV
jgi:hypothetical protein